MYGTFLYIEYHLDTSLLFSFDAICKSKTRAKCLPLPAAHFYAKIGANSGHLRKVFTDSAALHRIIVLLFWYTSPSHRKEKPDCQRAISSCVINLKHTFAAVFQIYDTFLFSQLKKLGLPPYIHD